MNTIKIAVEHDVIRCPELVAYLKKLFG